jgi:hypothetical protein
MGDARGSARLALTDADSTFHVFALDTNEGSSWYAWQDGGWNSEIMDSTCWLFRVAMVVQDNRVRICALGVRGTAWQTLL